MVIVKFKSWFYYLWGNCKQNFKINLCFSRFPPLPYAIIIDGTYPSGKHIARVLWAWFSGRGTTSLACRSGGHMSRAVR